MDIFNTKSRHNRSLEGINSPPFKIAYQLRDEPYKSHTYTMDLVYWLAGSSRRGEEALVEDVELSVENKPANIFERKVITASIAERLGLHAECVGERRYVMRNYKTNLDTEDNELDTMAKTLNNLCAAVTVLGRARVEVRAWAPGAQVGMRIAHVAAINTDLLDFYVPRLLGNNIIQARSPAASALDAMSPRPAGALIDQAATHCL